jgi:hypothetical protein
MASEMSEIGLTVELKVKGFGRFIGAGFLTCWLAGWAVGETVAISVLAVGAWSIVTKRPPGVGHDPVSLMAALPIGLFLLVWLTFWTFGGIAAGRELLQLLFGRDRFTVQHDGLVIEHSLGLFRSVVRLSRNEIRRFYPTSAGAALSVETARGTKVLTRLGTRAERAELEETLNREFNIPPQPALAGALPKGWCEELSLERDPVLVKDPAIRRKQARTAWIVFALLSSLWLYFLASGRARSDYLSGIIVLLILSAGVGWGAFWLSHVRDEWRLKKGRLVLQRRFGQNRKERFEAVTLELVEDRSGDDPSFELQAAAVGAAPLTGLRRTPTRHRRIIHSQSDGPTEPRNLGLWLSERCQVPFADLTTAEAKAKTWQP